MSNELKPCPFCGGETTFAAHATAEEMDYGIICRTMAVIGCDTCEFCMSEETDEEAVAAWNARTAVTDEQFSLAVHDGRVWQAVRECHDAGTSSNFFRCSSCGCEIMRCVDGWKPLYMGDVNYCPNCGAKVVSE